jgi:hypothetical protein
VGLSAGLLRIHGRAAHIDAVTTSALWGGVPAPSDKKDKEPLLKRYLAWITLAALAYVALSYFSFKLPATLADAELCGFVAGDFNAEGQLTHAPMGAWWISFVRKQEYWTALSVGLAIAFVAHALHIGRRAGGARVAGAAAGGGLLALSALCVSCLAPVLSAVGLGLAGSWLVGVPKWLIALNTLLLTGWGSLVLARRGAVCPLPSNAVGSATPNASANTRTS